jgi:hypothetical protein
VVRPWLRFHIPLIEPDVQYDFLDALGQTIASSDPANRELLAQTIDAYGNDFPDDFYWSISARAPLLLANLMMEIDSSCRPEA